MSTLTRTIFALLLLAGQATAGTLLTTFRVDLDPDASNPYVTLQLYNNLYATPPHNISITLADQPSDPGDLQFQTIDSSAATWPAFTSLLIGAGSNNFFAVHRGISEYSTIQAALVNPFDVVWQEKIVGGVSTLYRAASFPAVSFISSYYFQGWVVQSIDVATTSTNVELRFYGRVEPEPATLSLLAIVGLVLACGTPRASRHNADRGAT